MLRFWFATADGPTSDEYSAAPDYAIAQRIANDPTVTYAVVSSINWRNYQEIYYRHSGAMHTCHCGATTQMVARGIRKNLVRCPKCKVVTYTYN